MMIHTQTKNRKALAQAIAAELGTDYRYIGVPSCNYSTGDYTIDREGNIIGEDFEALQGFLLRNGYITEDALGAQTEAADEPGEREAPLQEPAAEPDEEESTEEPVAESTEDVDADLEAPTSMLSNIDEQIITIPAPGITVEQLRNLTYILYSRQYILNLMTGGDTIHIPLELVETLQEALPARPEDFTALLDSHRELGLEGFDFRDGEFSMTFPFYETEPTKWTAFAGLQGRILLAARAAKRVSPEKIVPEEAAERYTAYSWLQRLGYGGADFKAERAILLKDLHGYCAFADRVKMQRHRDKYAALRRAKREAQSVTEDGAPKAGMVTEASVKAEESVTAMERATSSESTKIVEGDSIPAAFAMNDDNHESTY